MSSQIQLESGFLKRTARRLRSEATETEAIAWGQLRGKRLAGLKFRRQHVLNGFIVDFYCHELKLCIEIDGGPHMDPDGKAKDKERDFELESLGYKMLHIPNEDVLNGNFRKLILDQISLPPL